MNKGFIPALYISLALFAIMMLMGSCSKQKGFDGHIEKADIMEDLTAANWHISNFDFNNIQFSSRFSDYVFHFNADSTLYVLNQAEQMQGAWLLTDDSESGVIDLQIQLQNDSNCIYSSLTGAWQVITYIPTHLQLLGKDDPKRVSR